MRGAFLFFVTLALLSLQSFADDKLPRKLPAKKTVAETTDATPADKDSDKLAEKAKGRKSPLDPHKALKLNYSLDGWVKDPTRIESGAVILRDGKSGKTARLEVTETAPGSGKFSGKYRINFGNADELAPEIYVPKDNTEINSKTKPESLEKEIAAQRVVRKPFVIHKDELGEQVIDVYNTREETTQALKDLEEQIAAKNTKLPQKLQAASSILEADKLAQIEAERRKQADAAAKAAGERAGLESQEKQKDEEMKRKEAALNAAEREKRKKQAQQYVEAALKFYGVGNFKDAETNFRMAHELDPENTSIYYRYGITLFRNDKFNDALVTFKLAEGKDVDPVEKQFYMGLAYSRINDDGNALRTFKEIKATKHPVYGPSAAFYEGMLFFKQLRYEQAKVSFQEVLDSSKDPKMDEKADEMIEQIDRLLQFAANKAKTILLGATIGTQYDSNILLDPAQPDAGQATNGGGQREILGGSVEWRPIYTTSTEWSLQTKADLIYSNNAVFIPADPLVLSAHSPFKYRGILWKKGYQMTLTPGYEALYLDTTSSGTKQDFMNSVTLDWSNSFVMSEDWISSYNFKYRSDNNLIVSSPLTDATAQKYSLGLNNIFFQNKKKTEAYTSDLGATQYTAVGSDETFTRFDLGAGYLHPFYWDTQAVLGLAFFSANYSTNSQGRKDTDYALNAALSKPIVDWLSAALAGNYTINNSNVNAYAYKKYTLTLVFTANYGL